MLVAKLLQKALTLFCAHGRIIMSEQTVLSADCRSLALLL